MHTPNSQTILGISLFTFHCFLFTVIASLSKQLMEELHVSTILLFQTGFAALILLPRVYFRHRHKVVILSMKLQFLAALCWLVGTALFYTAITQIQLPEATAISFSVPIFTTILAIIFLKESLHARRVMGLCFGVLGMLVIIQPGMKAFDMASLLVIGSAMCWSFCDIFIKLMGKTHHPFVNTFYFALISMVLLLPVAIYVNDMPSTAEQWIWLAVIALLFVVNIASTAASYQLVDLTVLMPFIFTELVFIGLLAYFMFGEVIQIPTAIGGFIIIASTSYITYREYKTHKQSLVEEWEEKLPDPVEHVKE